MSSPGPLFSLHSTAPSDKVAGQSVGRRVGCWLQDLEDLSALEERKKPNQQTRWSYITITHQQWRDGFDNINNKEKAAHRCQPLLSCFKLYSGELSGMDGFKLLLAVFSTSLLLLKDKETDSSSV